MEHIVTAGFTTDTTKEFIELSGQAIVFLLILGFLGGLISGFIGSGGAFVLTPGMMSLGVPGAVAVASNMCHKFPKAMVGAYKRFKYGQIDIRLGIIMAVSAVVGVQLGIQIQEMILDKWGEAGSNLYISLVFVTILTVIGLYMLLDARKSMRSGSVATVSKLAQRLHRLKIPPMVRFPLIDVTMSLWITVPVGFATGLLAATIAVGGFIGVPGMIYVLGIPALIASATELVIAFLMGLSGTVTWALGGFVDIRLTLIILAASLFGVQLGAIGTTYVKDYMVKIVMAVIMVVVAISRGFAIPGYLNDLGTVAIADNTVSLLDDVSFVIMCVAMAIGGVIILGSMWKGKRAVSKSPVQAIE